MQGRLVQSSNGRLDCSPGPRWREEFWSAGALRLNHIELVADRQLDSSNPIWSTEGREEMACLARSAHVEVVSLCLNEALDTPVDEVVRRCTPRLEQVTTGLRIDVIVVPLLEASDLESMDNRSAAAAVALLAERTTGRRPRIAVEVGVPAAQSLRFLDLVSSPRVGICYDTGNASALGMDPAKELGVLGPAVWHLHAKDKDGLGHNVAFGTGEVDFRRIFEQLARQGFGGLVTMEATRGDDPVVAAAAHRDFLLAVDRAASGPPPRR